MALRNQHRTSKEADQFVDGLLAMAQNQLAKEQTELAEEKVKLKQSQANLQKEEEALQRAKAERQQAEARLQQSDARLQQSGEKLAKEQEISANKKKFKTFSEQEVLPFKEANESLKQCTDRLKPRMELAIAVATGIEEYQALKEEALKKTKLAGLQETMNTIEQSIREENTLQQQSLDQVAPWKAILAQMKAWIDVLPEEDRNSYETQIKRYESSIRRFKNFEERYQKMLPSRSKVDKACQEMKGKVALLTEAFQAESPEHAVGTPPSPVSSKAGSTPPRSDSDSDQMAVAAPSSGESSGDVSPAGSPKKGVLLKEEKQEVPAVNLASAVVKPVASQPQPPAAAPGSEKKGLLSKLFTSTSKKPAPPALPPKNPGVNNGNGQNQGQDRQQVKALR